MSMLYWLLAYASLYKLQSWDVVYIYSLYHRTYSQIDSWTSIFILSFCITYYNYMLCKNDENVLFNDLLLNGDDICTDCTMNVNSNLKIDLNYFQSKH